MPPNSYRGTKVPATDDQVRLCAYDRTTSVEGVRDARLNAVEVRDEE